MLSFFLATCHQSIWIKPHKSLLLIHVEVYHWDAHSVVISTTKYTLNLIPAPEPGQRSRIPTSLRTERSGVWIPSEEEIFLFSKMFRPALRRTRPPVQWVPEFFPDSKSARFVMHTTHPHLVRRLRMRRELVINNSYDVYKDNYIFLPSF
jgi:hypothetical protein